MTLSPISQQRFTMLAPNDECFSAVVAGGAIDFSDLNRIVIHSDVHLTDSVARTLWRGTSTKIDTARFVARATTNPELLAEMLRRDTRRVVRGAALCNPATPLDAIFELSVLDQPAHRTSITDAKTQLTERFAAMPTPALLTNLTDGLPTAVFTDLKHRNDITYELAEHWIARTWLDDTKPRGQLTNVVSFATLVAPNPWVARDWTTTQLAHLVNHAVSASLAAAALVTINQSLMGDEDFAALCLDLSVGGRSADEYDTHTTRLVTAMSACRQLSAAHIARILPADIKELSAAVALAGHANSNPSWWSSCTLDSPAGIVTAARLLAADPTFHDPGMWQGALALAGSWHGTVGDFVVAAQTLLER